MKEELKKLFDGRAFNFAGLVRTTDSNVILRLTESEKLYDIEFYGVQEVECLFKETALISSFTYSLDDPYLWNYGEWSSICGTAPLPDVPKFFYDFHEIVRDKLKVDRDPMTYLNTKSTILEWKNFVYSRAYSLLSAPTQVAKVACDLLDRQAAEYAMLKDPEIKTVPGLSLVTLTHEDKQVIRVVYKELKISS